MASASFWLNTDRPPDDARVLWVGAGAGDTGLSFTRLTFQVTHATDSDTNAERDYIIGELREKRVIEAITEYQSGQLIPRNTSTTTLPMAKSRWQIWWSWELSRLSGRGADRRMGAEAADVGARVLGSAEPRRSFTPSVFAPVEIRRYGRNQETVAGTCRRDMSSAARSREIIQRP